MSILVSWATCDAVVQSLGAGNCTGTSRADVVTRPVVVDNLLSVVKYGRKGRPMVAWGSGKPTSYAYKYAGLMNYASPVLHHVLLQGEDLGHWNESFRSGLHVLVN